MVKIIAHWYQPQIAIHRVKCSRVNNLKRKHQQLGISLGIHAQIRALLHCGCEMVHYRPLLHGQLPHERLQTIVAKRSHAGSVGIISGQAVEPRKPRRILTLLELQKNLDHEVKLPYFIFRVQARQQLLRLLHVVGAQLRGSLVAGQDHLFRNDDHRGSRRHVDDGPGVHVVSSVVAGQLESLGLLDAAGLRPLQHVGDVPRRILGYVDGGDARRRKWGGYAQASGRGWARVGFPCRHMRGTIRRHMLDELKARDDLEG
mmetsp:Transcript_9110/g.21406  ORF Transcript_9110/g.21406 Transcript_9110/m.21406 type:complete len:259 (+) Transcript_9110:518-1294(+)